MAQRRMIKLDKQREIFDRKAVVTTLEALGGGDPRLLGSRKARAEVLALMKDVLAKGQTAVEARLAARASGSAVVAANTFLIDQLLRVLFDHAAETLFPEPNPTTSDRLALVAIGGYGRGELAPQSDVDILFLHPYKLTARSEQIVEYILYMLWDLGLKVGQATRSVRDCVRRAEADMTIRTSLLESRFLWGAEPLYQEFRTRFRTEVIPGTEAAFVAAKLAERDERHKRAGESRYLLEPNVKDGKGGLRDLHTLFWIAKYLYRVDRFEELVERGVMTRKEFSRFSRAENFLWRVRAHLHVLSGRPEERLTFDVQPEIAKAMGYAARQGNLGVERFMKHYFLVAKTVGELTRVFCAALEADHLQVAPVRADKATLGIARPGFRIEGGRIAIENDEAFADDPVRLIEIFRIAQQEGRDIHPRVLRLIHQSLALIDQPVRDDARANRLFMALLTDPHDAETALRRLNESGVLGRFVPDFGRVIAQTQHDMYHVYTVDEHTVRAVGILTGIEGGRHEEELPLASEIVHEVLSREVLYVATFLHDIAKGRGGDHSELGAEIAETLCPRLGMSDEQTETVAWLVREHLLFSHTAFKRDINDPKTVADFVGRVQSIERLRLLLVLTAADIRAVGPGRWNGWKGSLLRELYRQAEDVLTGGHAAAGREARLAAARADLRARLDGWDDARFQAYADRFATPYWLTADAETHARHAAIVARAEADPAAVIVETRVDQFRAVTEVTLYAPDRPGLFASLAGATAQAGASIVDAKAFTTADGMALDSLWLQDRDGGAYDEGAKLARLKSLVGQAVRGEIEFDVAGKPHFPARTEVFQIKPRVLVDNKASNSHTVIEINGRDRPGLLHDVARVLTALNLSISSAHISTFGTRAVDVFYVKDRYGLKVTKDRPIDELTQRLIEALSAGELGALAAE